MVVQRSSRRHGWQWEVSGSLSAVLVFGLLLVALYSGADVRNESMAGRIEFGYRASDKLTLNGAPHRFLGVNNYDLAGCHTGKPVSESNAQEFFAQLPPCGMARTFEGGA